MVPCMSGSLCAPAKAPRRKSRDGSRRVVGFERWWVVAGFLQTFLHPRVRKGVFEKNPPQPTTMAKPTTLRGRGLFQGPDLRGGGRGSNGGGVCLVSRLFSGCHPAFKA